MQMQTDKLWIELGNDDHVSAVLAGPDPSGNTHRIGLIFAHGAGNGMHTPLIVALAEGLAVDGYMTLRFNFPYKEKGRKSPDSQARLELTWQRVWETMQTNDRFAVDRIIAVGKSMGGRVASQMAADNRMPAAGLIFLGYPLHAPGRKDQLKDAHLYRIQVPMLFFAGTRDPLCDLGKLENVLARLACPHELEIVDGGNHSFMLTKSAGRRQEGVYDQILNGCRRWLRSFPADQTG
jgi:predicted alpha/beta-hydrolase family hydrolase